MAAPTEANVVLIANNAPQSEAIAANRVSSEESSAANGSPPVYDRLPSNGATPEQSAQRIGFDLAGFVATMRTESERLKTFLYGEWSVSFLRPQDLAKAGFFFLQNGDRVQCAFCRGVVCKWEDGDIPLVEHARHYPRCPFVAGYDVGNVPIGRDPVRDKKLARPGQDAFGSYRNALERAAGIMKPEIVQIPSSSSLKEYGIQVYQKPMFKKFVTTQSRVKSFRGTKLLKYSPKELAHSGFFFTDGRLVCAFCGLLATEKELSLNPWEEHARREPECYFIQISKGPRFVESCLRIPLGKVPESSATKSSEKNAAHSDGDVKTENGALISCDMNGNSVEKLETSGAVEKKSENAKDAPMEIESNTVPRIHESLTAFMNSGLPIRRQIASSEAEFEGATASFESVPSSPESTSPLSSLETVPSLLLKDERLLCKVCLDSEVGVVFLPCSHLVACTACATVTPSCPICRKEIKAMVRTFFT